MKHTAILAAHPLRKKPYDKLRFHRFDDNGIALYGVHGSPEPPVKALRALQRAFSIHGGRCFYCNEQLGPQDLSASGPHRDHVIPASGGGTDSLHNLVIACGLCGRVKGRDDIFEFRPKAAKAWLAALEAHIRRSLAAGR